MQTTRPRDGFLRVRHSGAAKQPAETCRAYEPAGQPVDAVVPFAKSVAGTVVSMQESFAMNDLSKAGAIELQPFEKNRKNLLAAPVTVTSGLHAVIELFDKPEPFTADDQRLVRAAADLGAEMLRQALGQRQAHELLLDAVAAALGASAQVEETLQGTSDQRLEQPPPVEVLDQLRAGLRASGGDQAAAEQSLKLAEAIRVLTVKDGPVALEHCLKLVEQVRGLLDTVNSG